MYKAILIWMTEYAWCTVFVCIWVFLNNPFVLTDNKTNEENDLSDKRGILIRILISLYWIYFIPYVLIQELKEEFKDL